MAKSTSFNKRELEKKRQSKKLEKQQRKANNTGRASFEDMIAYVDENGVITQIPPELREKKQEVEAESILISTPKKEETEPLVLKGRVEHFNKDKGFGFIKDIASTEKYFFHISNAPSSITEGNMVTFELERGQRGMSAVKINLTK